MKRKPHCKKHPEQSLICPKCVGRKGGAKSLASITPEQFKAWGKLGGRPRKPKLETFDATNAAGEPVKVTIPGPEGAA
jgi:hypothetical protein